MARELVARINLLEVVSLRYSTSMCSATDTVHSTEIDLQR
jgi:hypothetical protein